MKTKKITASELIKALRAELKKLKSDSNYWESDKFHKSCHELFVSFHVVSGTTDHPELDEYMLKATSEEGVQKVLDTLMKAETEKVARKFSELMLECVGMDIMKEIIQTNKEQGGEYCATGDHCDSNQVFIDALEACGYVAYVDANDDDQIDFNNTAWDLAKANNFYIQ